jgi:thiamine biosynthesis lipoprotein
MRIRSPLILGLLLVAACSEQRPAILEISGSTMGTSFSVKLPTLPPNVDPGSLGDAIGALLLAIEMQMSTYRIDSEISRFNVSESTAWQPVSAEFCRAAEQSLDISRKTAGAFDITVGPLVNLWGFGPDGAVRKPPSAGDIARTQARVGYSHLQTDCSIPALRKDIARLYLDMSAYAKGYAVDRVANVLDQLDARNYLVEIGGEMKLKGHNADGEKWVVAIEEPLQGERRVHSMFRITDQSVATSGDYRNFFESGGTHYSHTIDTRTGRPVTHKLASVTVVAETTAVADAMATALLVLGPEDGMILALSLDIAAFFLIHGKSGIEEMMTPAFAAFRTKQ